MTRKSVGTGGGPGGATVAVLVAEVVVVVASVAVVRMVTVAVVVVSAVTVVDEIWVRAGAVAVERLTVAGMVRQAQALDIREASYVPRTDSESGFFGVLRFPGGAATWVTVRIVETVAVSVDKVVSVLVINDVRMSVRPTVAVVTEILEVLVSREEISTGQGTTYTIGVTVDTTDVDAGYWRYELQKGSASGRFVGVLRRRRRLSALHEPRSSSDARAKTSKLSLGVVGAPATNGTPAKRADSRSDCMIPLSLEEKCHRIQGRPRTEASNTKDRPQRPPYA